MASSGRGEDYYAVLGLPRGASAAEVRRAYRRLAVQWHPVSEDPVTSPPPPPPPPPPPAPLPWRRPQRGFCSSLLFAEELRGEV